MKEIEFDLDKNPFMDFQIARYSMSARINVEKMWKYSKENDYSFFVLSLGSLMDTVNSIPQFKRRIDGNKVIEYDYLDGICPIMNKEDEIFKEMKVKPPSEFKDFNKWYSYVKKTSRDVLSGKQEEYKIPMNKRDEENVANYSCIPWIDFDSLSSCILTGNQIQPLITWGKVNKNYEMTIAVTVNHIFINGHELGSFYKNAQENFNHLD